MQEQTIRAYLISSFEIPYALSRSAKVREADWRVGFCAVDRSDLPCDSKSVRKKQDAKPIEHQAMHTRTILQQSNSWKDFKAGLRPLDKKTKGDAFEALIYHYLRLHPEYETKLSKVWRLREVPAGVRRKLNLPGPDEGIDLVAKTKEGEYWAIQCKYREDESKSLIRKDLSTRVST